jgi:hypothetical protein
MDKIFVQIASYRDSELRKTIEDCILQAELPERLTFGIVNQYNTNDSFCFDINQYQNDSRFKILNIPSGESLGACWARSETNKMYQNEKFTLQIDSHSRFVENWDSKIISSWQELSDEKAIYTSYPPPYHPNDEKEKWAQYPYIIHVYSIQGNMTKQRPKQISDWKTRSTPYKARHLAAGFIFGKGDFIKEIPYDPDFYFSGEETSLMIRFFTHGYNLYHPNDIFLWHYYTRKDSPKHWHDQKTSSLTSKSRDRLRCLLGLKEGHIDEQFGLGKQRSLNEFKMYSGIDFERNILHKDVIEAKEPPVDQSTESWSIIRKSTIKKLKWDANLISEEEDSSFWAFFIKDSNGNTIKRKDITKEKYPEIINKVKNEIDLEIDFYYPAQEPTSFVIWPYSKSKKWLKKSDLIQIEGSKKEVYPMITNTENDNSKQKSKVLIVGSGKSGEDVKSYESIFDFIVVVNNAWALTNKWAYWIHPNDYKGLKPDSIRPDQFEVKATNGYGKSLRKYGGIHECGFSIMLNASYWALDNLNPKEIYYLGADMNYCPDENGNTHFYGVGFDIKNKGISDPDLMVKVRGNGDPDYLIKIYKRFENIANQNDCKLYNLSRDEKTRLPYEKFFII